MLLSGFYPHHQYNVPEVDRLSVVLSDHSFMKDALEVRLRDDTRATYTENSVANKTKLKRLKRFWTDTYNAV